MRNDLWTDYEMEVVLGFYLFDEKRDDKKIQKAIADNLNRITGKNRTGDAIGYRIGNYKTVDPNYKKAGLTSGQKLCKKYWDIYVTNDPSKTKIANIYSKFINGCVTSIIQGGSTLSSVKTTVTSVVVYNRSQVVKDKTLQRANGVCELCCNKAPFLNKEKKPYLEVHHYIPLSCGGDDLTTNTLALCPNCHRRMHSDHNWLHLRLQQ